MQFLLAPLFALHQDGGHIIMIINLGIRSPEIAIPHTPFSCGYIFTDLFSYLFQPTIWSSPTSWWAPCDEKDARLFPIISLQYHKQLSFVVLVNNIYDSRYYKTKKKLRRQPGTKFRLLSSSRSDRVFFFVQFECYADFPCSSSVHKFFCLLFSWFYLLGGSW